MFDIIYTILIFPIEQIIELIFVFIFRITKNPGFSIFGLSIAVSTLLLPIYNMAENQQQAERDKQKLMKRMKDNINAVFKGDKRYMLLSVLYRQNNYHPIFALRSSFSLFIMIPFFIAARNFLINLEVLNGKSFFVFSDLSAPDGLLFGFNLLPILMTLINVFSGYIYTKGFEIKDKIQVYGIALIFLVLLYNSPSALLIYWTCNNIYSLFKNILVKIKISDKFIKYIILLIAITIILYIIFFAEFWIKTKLIIIFSLIFITVILFIWKKTESFLNQKINLKNTSLEYPFKTFILSLIGVLLLIGLVTPSSLIASNVAEFSYLGKFNSPLPYIGFTFLQSIGFFILLLSIYFLFDKKIKIILTVSITVILGIFFLNTLTFTNEYGIMTPNLSFEQFDNISLNKKALS